MLSKALKIVEDKTVGQLNGLWSYLFRLLLAANVLLIPVAVTWGWGLQTAIWKMQYDMRISTMDRFTTAMFIEAQDVLQKKDPNHPTLDADDIREIQKRNAPYSHH